MPLKNGVDDTMFVDVFTRLFNESTRVFEPDVVVCQCGADGLTGDPLGGFNLTSAGIVKCVETVSRYNVPLMILGGGGYNVVNTARCWTEVVACLLGTELSDDIPDHEHLDKYGPDYSLKITPGNRKNENTREYIEGAIELLTENLKLLIPVADDKDENKTVKTPGDLPMENQLLPRGDKDQEIVPPYTKNPSSPSIAKNILVHRKDLEQGKDKNSGVKSDKRQLDVVRDDDGNKVKKVCEDKTNIYEFQE